MGVEEGDEEGDEGEGKAEDEGSVGRVFERGDIIKGTRFPRRKTGPQESDRESKSTKHDEGHRADSPGEADRDDQAANKDWIDNSADAAPACCHAGCQRSLCGKIGSNDSDAGCEETAAPQTYAETLCEENLVVLAREGEHHHTEDLEEGARDRDGVKVSGIETAATDDSEAEK